MLLQDLATCPAGMDSTIISGVVASIFSLWLGLFVYSHNRQHSVHRAFFFLNICVFLWNLQAFVLYLANIFKPELLLLVHKVFSIPSYFVLFASAWLIFSFAGMQKTRLYNNILRFYFIAAVVVTIMSFLPGFSDSVSICPLREGIGPWYYVFIGYLSLASAYNMTVLYGLYKNSASLRKRNQLRYALIGLLTGLSAIGTYFATLIWPNIPQVYFLMEIVYLLIFAYAILKYKLMDINIAWRYLISYGTYGVFASAGFLLAAYLLGAFSAKLMLLVIGAIILSPLTYKYYAKSIKPLLFGRYTEQLDKIREDERIEYTSHKLACSTINSIFQTIPIDNISIFLFDKMFDKFHPIAEIGNPDLGSWQFPLETLEKNDELIRYLETTRKHLLKDDLHALTEKEHAGSIPETFNRLRAELGMPVFIENKLQGILFVGSKKGNTEYHEEDITKLQQLTKILSMHLSHSMFMEERTVYSRKLAHDMKNLIHKGLLLTAQLAEETNENKSSERKQALLKQINYLDNIMRQFYDMNSVLNKVQFRNYALSPVNIPPLLNDVVTTFTPAFDSKKIAIQTELAGIPAVLGNAEDLTKVFHNLLDNSLKFMNQGYVRISADVKETGLLIKYEDTGIGISKERLEQIWEPFYRIDSEKTAGLGLTIIREIIEAHKGKIWVESEENKGTTFFFTLQLAP